MEREAKNLKTTYDKDQIAAGIGRLEKFGVKATLHALTGGDILKEEAILRCSYNEIFLQLWYGHDVAEFQKRFRKVTSKK